MRRIAGPLLACALALANAPANGQAGATPATPHNSEKPPPSTASELHEPSARPPTTDDICRALEGSAAENSLPVEFFARVIWQESRFDARAISPKGAAGIAQFMPATASWHGLADPFDPIESLRHSAAYLRELLNRFGNLGLAAAAYNAGPQRVQDWLSARGGLPKETRHYVQIVTGRSAEEWTGGTTEQDGTLPERVPCPDVVKSMSYRTAARSDGGIENPPSRGGVPQTKPGWGVQLVGSPSQASALASFQQLQKAYKNLLMARQPTILQSKVGTSGFWYRVRVVTDTRTEAEKLCSGLRAAGSGCLVQRN
jgi:Transglycosylase SLT domain/SPOR domain